MFSHPLVLALIAVVTISYVGGALLMLQMRKARPGFEDENGFHFLDELDDVVVPADEVRPAWLTESLASRFCGHRAEIFAAAHAA